MERQSFPSVQCDRLEIRSPVFEETVAQISDVEASIMGRPLTPREEALVQGVFGRSVDYSRIRLIETRLLEYRTVGNTIRVPPNFTISNAEMAETLVHEMTHALQHQNFAASAQAEQASGLDAMLAFQALLEGDAEFTESVFLHPEDLKDPEACARRIRADTDAWEQQIRQSAMMTPMVLSRSQAFWYTRGQEFVHSLHRTGGWNAVNRAWGAPPASTEQVLHPGKYAAREYPVRLDTSGIEARLIADGWAIRYSTTAGELVLEIWLETRSPAPLDVDGCFKAAAGWGGDRAILAERGKTRLGVWVTTWDAPEDAAEFAAAAAKTLPPDKAATDSAGRAIHATADGRHAVLRRGRDVLVLLGCPEETLPGIEDEAWKVPHLDEVERK